MDLHTDMINIAKIIDGIFLGDVIAGTTLDIVFEFKISHMINTASNQIPSQFTSIGVKYLNLNWPENPSLNIPLIKDELANKIVNYIDNCLKNGDGLMIYSMKGQNRCCAIILIYLMKKYFWSLEKSKQFLLSKKPDMKLTKNFSEQLNNYQIHLHKLFPNRKRSINWSEENIKDNDELLMRNTYINDVELAKKKNLVSESKIKNSERHVGWADDNKNENNEKKLVNYDIENDLFFKKKVKDITSHLNIAKELKSIIKKDEKEGKSDNNNNNNKNELCLEESIKDDKMEFFDTKNLLRNKAEKGDNTNEDILNRINKDNEQLEENNQNLGNKKEEENRISLDNELYKSDNKMKLNIFKNLNQKEPLSNSNNFPINLPLKDFGKMKENNMNSNFNSINLPDANKKYYNNFISNDNNKIFKNNNNIYPIYLKPNKTQKKSRSTSKTNHKNNIPFIEYNQNNNIITNIMINNNPQIINDNQKFFIKFNKDNNLINGNNQFIQNNNFININYYPQSNESKYELNNYIFFIYRYNPRNK